MFLADTGFGEGKRSLNRSPKRSLKEALEWEDMERQMDIDAEERVAPLGTYKKKPYWEDDLDSDQEL